MTGISLLACATCSRTDYASLMDGVCDRCRGRARTEEVKRRPAGWRTTYYVALCVECEWVSTGVTTGEINAEAHAHAKATKHGVVAQRQQSRPVRYATAARG